MSAEAALIWCPFGDIESAAAVTQALLKERLVACGNAVPGITSRFLWQGEAGEESECAVLFKTRADLLERAMERLEILHPYDQPAISGWTVRTTRATMDWLEAETAVDTGGK